ncbi:MAG: hypothetical protein HQ546_05505 [Planctomycetes bacterium]|nr:hypothetical protein [Planctomycetota bacterium]
MAKRSANGFYNIYNKRLLLAAVALGVIFVVLLNVQSWRDEADRRRNQVAFVLVKGDLPPGQTLTNANIEKVHIPLEVGEKLKGLYPWSNVVLGQTTVKQLVVKNSLLRKVDTEQMFMEPDTTGMKLGWRTISLPVDSQGAPAGYVRRGVRVDLYGAIDVPGEPAAKMQLIIESLEVMGVGGQAGGDGRRSFRSVEVQVPAELVPKLLEVKRRLVGRMTLVVRRSDDLAMAYPHDPSRPSEGGTLTRAVWDLLTSQVPVRGRGGLGE